MNYENNRHKVFAIRNSPSTSGRHNRSLPLQIYCRPVADDTGKLFLHDLDEFEHPWTADSPSRNASHATPLHDEKAGSNVTLYSNACKRPPVGRNPDNARVQVDRMRTSDRVRTPPSGKEPPGTDRGVAAPREVGIR